MALEKYVADALLLSALKREKEAQNSSGPSLWANEKTQRDVFADTPVDGNSYLPTRAPAPSANVSQHPPPPSPPSDAAPPDNTSSETFEDHECDHDVEHNHRAPFSSPFDHIYRG